MQDIGEMKQVPRINTKQKIMYALGQFGWSMLNGIVVLYLVSFYTPMGEGGLDIKMNFLPKGNIFGIVSVIVLANILGRIVDAVTDPIIGSLSDRSAHPKGRRMSFLIKGAIPFGIFTVLMFFMPINGPSIINAIWLIVTLIGSYVFYTMYVTPYFALINDLGHTTNDRLDLSTYISITWFLGYTFANFTPIVWNVIAGLGVEFVWAVRITIALFAFISVVLMLLPVVFIDEKKYVYPRQSTEPTKYTIKTILTDPNYKVFIIADAFYFFAVTVFQLSVPFYITVLLKLEDSWQFLVLAIAGVISFLCYPIVNIYAKKVGKRKLVLIALGVYATAFLYAGFLGQMGVSATIQVVGLVILVCIPMAILGILPNVMISDMAEYDYQITKSSREGVYFGVRTMVTKFGQMLGVITIGGMLQLMDVLGADIGVRFSAYISFAACLIGLAAMFFYDEKQILEHADKEEI